MGKARAILIDAADHFVADDGWAIASHIALSTLTSLFPFLIFVTALAGFLGTQSLADEAMRLIFAGWPAEVAGPIAAEVHDVLTAQRGTSQLAQGPVCHESLVQIEKYTGPAKPNDWAPIMPAA